MDLTGASQKKAARPNWMKKQPMDAAVDEAIDSEDKYKRNLENCVRYYINPLRRQAGTIGLTDREVGLLISNFEELATFHARTMFPALSSRKVVDAWLEHAADLKRLYLGYMSTFADSIQIQAVLQSNGEYRKFIQGQRMERTTGYLDLTSYLQFPVTRITAYAKSVLAIIKVTPSNSPMSSRLTSCFDKLREIAEAIDKVKRDVQSDLQSGRLMTRVRQQRGDPGYVSPRASPPPVSPPVSNAPSPRSNTGYHAAASPRNNTGSNAPSPRNNSGYHAPPAGPVAPPMKKPMMPPPVPAAAAAGGRPPPPPPAAVAASSQFKSSPAPRKPLPRLP